MSRHVVYRVYGDAGLLYIGATSKFDGRMSFHRTRSPWWMDMTDVTIEEHPTRDAAFAAERDAILVEQPIFNCLHRKPVCAFPTCNFAVVDGEHCYNHSDTATFPADDERHGTANAYQNYGCRCDECREAWRSYCAERRARVAA